jgi:excisionase family DNA binding protein
MSNQERSKEAYKDVNKASPWGKALLDVEDVASYLEVSPTTVWRWCRDGTLPSMKIARRWRIRREALEDFLQRSERSQTLVGQLRPFLRVPDNILATAQTHDLMIRLDAAFFQIGLARGGVVVKYVEHEKDDALVELRDTLERNALDVSRLEEEGRISFVYEEGKRPVKRAEELRKLLAKDENKDRSMWICFNWDKQAELETALEHQEEITQLAENSLLVVKTSMLEDELDEWPGADLRRAQVMHLGTIWISEKGVALSRVSPPP